MSLSLLRSFANRDALERWTDPSAPVMWSSAVSRDEGPLRHRHRRLRQGGEVSLSGITTIVGLARPNERGYRDRTPAKRVWLLDGAESGYVNTSAPRGQLYHV